MAGTAIASVRSACVAAMRCQRQCIAEHVSMWCSHSVWRYQRQRTSDAPRVAQLPGTSKISAPVQEVVPAGVDP
eukprot:2531214-Rhodomonas_salina.1